MLVKYNDKHRFYDFLHKIIDRSEYEIVMVKTLSSRFSISWLGRFSSYFFSILDIFYVPFLCYKNFRKDFIVVREFNTLPYLLASFFSFPLRHKLLLNVNHNFQRTYTSKLHALIVRVLDFLGFRFLCFECAELPVHLRNKIIEIPFLIEKKNNFKEDISCQRIVVGVVGSIRPEKDVERLLKNLDENKLKFSGVNFLLGCDDHELIEKYRKKDWLTLNTNDYDQYLSALNSSDILVFNYKEKDYRFRHSGVITDAIANNKVVIAPDYPYFNKQIKEPVKVGVLFSSLNDIEQAINEALTLVNSKERNVRHEHYCEFRNIESITHSLKCQLDSI